MRVFGSAQTLDIRLFAGGGLARLDVEDARVARLP
jgi:hypothetical protein